MQSDILWERLVGSSCPDTIDRGEVEATISQAHGFFAKFLRRVELVVSEARAHFLLCGVFVEVGPERFGPGCVTVKVRTQVVVDGSVEVFNLC
jgi:hypothetical protein